MVTYLEIPVYFFSTSINISQVWQFKNVVVNMLKDITEDFDKQFNAALELITFQFITLR